MNKKSSLLILLLIIVMAPVVFASELSITEKQWVKEASRKEVNGWTYVTIKGKPFQRGFQHGYLVANEYAEAIRTYKAITLHTIGVPYDFFVKKAAQMHKSKITPELLEEMSGIAAGLTKAGVPTTLDDIIGWNAYMEITGYWWPTVAAQYAKSPEKFEIQHKEPNAHKVQSAPNSKAPPHCSAFIATGSATEDGRIVIGHETFIEFWGGQYFNIILDITPDKGHRMVMQATPGYIASMTDFWVTGAGLVITETTIAGFVGYDPDKIPEYVRVRNASQYANTIDQWVKLIEKGNNGGYANLWLIGDTNTNEIASYEQGLAYQSFSKKKDGWYYGANTPEDPRIRNLECTYSGYSDIRQQTGARRTRWPQLLTENKGRINANVGQTMLADTFDVYLMKNNPSSRTICGHYDQDPQPYVSNTQAVWNEPFYPAGSVDGKVTTAELAKNMGMWGRFGRADGIPFDAKAFFKTHPQWNWQQDYVKSLPHQPWTLFNGNNKAGATKASQ